MSGSTHDNPGYWLFYTQRCVSHAFTEALKACCVALEKPYALTPPQWGVLSTLYDQDGRTIGSISQIHGLDAPTTTGIVTRLQQLGLVQRVHDSKDRRLVKVYLTDESRALRVPLVEAVAAFNNIEMRGFSPSEQQDFLHTLQRIIVNVSSVAPGTGDRFGWLPDTCHKTLDAQAFKKEEEA